MRRLLGVDPLTGTAEYVDYDDSEDVFRYHQEVEAQPLLDVNRECSNDMPVRWGNGRVVARMNMLQWMLLHQLGILYDKKALKRWLNDADHRGFRIMPGRV